MPAQRAILANIHDNNLDPNVAHSKLQNGSLVCAKKEQKEQHAHIFASTVLSVEPTESTTGDLEKTETQQEEETTKKPKKGFQKKTTQNVK